MPFRSEINQLVHTLAIAIEEKDMATLLTQLHPQARVTWSQGEAVGADITALLAKTLQQWQQIRVHIKRVLIDVEQCAVAIEWVIRGTAANGCHEFLGGTALDFNAAGLIANISIYRDTVRSGSIGTITDTWPTEPWIRAAEPGPPPSRAECEQLLWAHAAGWSAHDIACLQTLLHPEVCFSPPWDYRVGLSQVERIARYHFEVYSDTQVTVQRVIYDEMQPYFGVCQQEFACTSSKTGRRGADSDFAFFEIAQGQLRYWRNYFDSEGSVQDGYDHVN